MGQFGGESMFDSGKNDMNFGGVIFYLKQARVNRYPTSEPPLEVSTIIIDAAFRVFPVVSIGSTTLRAADTSHFAAYSAGICLPRAQR